jgi:hypothetical protein
MLKRFVLIGILFIGVHEINCQSCDQKLSPIDNENLKYKSRGNRCEGFYSTDISASKISLVSLTCGSFDYSLTDSEIIDITPLFDNGKKIHIQSSSLLLRKYYRMDSEISSDSKLEWPVADVLKPAVLTPEKIGILGKVLPENNTPVIIPLKVKSTILSSDNCKKIQLIFNSSIDLDTIIFYFGQLNKDEKPVGQLIDDRVYYAGSPIILNIDISSFENYCYFFITGSIRTYKEIPSNKDDDKMLATKLDPYYFIIELPAK